MLIWLIPLAAVLFVVVTVADVHLTTRRLLRYLRTVDLSLRSQEGPLHDNASATLAALEGAGFEPEAQGVISAPAQGHRAVFLLRSRTGESIAEVVVLDGGTSDQVQLSIESWIPGGRLATQTVQGLIALPGQLKQVFPEADVAELLVEHGRALEALEATGRRAIPIAEHDVERRWAGALREDAERHPSGLGVTLRALRIVRGHIEDLGSVVERGLV